jgi:hypothetical protein
MTQTLADTLSRSGKATTTWTSPDGSSVLVLPYGGRILALSAPGSGRNFLWTHPALNSVASANEFYGSAEWHNSGGDRTWLSAEIDFFLPNYPRADSYLQPRAFDPGDYRLSNEPGTVALCNSFSVRHARSGQDLKLTITKRLQQANNPLSNAPDPLRRLAYAGYTLRTTLEFAGTLSEPAPVSLWSLLQLPHGGELLIPTTSRVTPKIYMGKIDPEDLASEDHLIRYRMRSAGEHKLGITPAGAIGRAGYFYHAGSDACLVVRSFSIDPMAHYVDSPWNEPDAPGSVIEACNVNSNLGAFSELEYHTPAINGLAGSCCCADQSQVWAFAGPEPDILEAIRLLVCQSS